MAGFGTGKDEYNTQEYRFKKKNDQYIKEEREMIYRRLKELKMEKFDKKNPDTVTLRNSIKKGMSAAQQFKKRYTK